MFLGQILRDVDPANPATPAAGGEPANPAANPAAPAAPENKGAPAASATPAEPVVSAKEFARLRALEEASGILIRGDTSPEKRKEAMIFIMEQNHYTPEQIQEALTRGGEPAPTGEPDPVVQAVQQNANELRQIRINQVRRSMDEATQKTFDPKGPVGLLLGELATARGTAFDKDKVEKMLTARFRDQVATRLRDRTRNGTVQYQDSWMGEEASTVAAAIAEEYRTAIGDVSLIGRAPETVSGEDEFLKSAPKTPPKYKDGMNPGDMQAQAHDFTVDALTRLTFEGSGNATRA